MLLGGDTITLFTGEIMQVDFDEARVILKLRDKLNRFLKQRIGSGQQVRTKTATGAADLAWAILTESAANAYGAGLDDTKDPGNTDIDHPAWEAWKAWTDGNGFSLQAKITGHTVKWCLDRICKMTNSYIWQRGDGKITFAPPLKNGEAYGVNGTDKIKLSLLTDTILNNIKVYFTYDPDTGDWDNYTSDSDTNSQSAFGIISETDDNNIIWHDDTVSATKQAEKVLETYDAPIRMFDITAFLPAFEEELTNQINITKAVYGVSGQTGIIEAISYDLSNAQVNMRARWAW